MHILASPGYAPETIAVNVTWMKRGFNACRTHCSIYPSVFNRFPVIQPVISKVRHFSTFLCTFWPPLGQSLHRYSYMDGKRIQCWSNVQQNIPIYLQPFTSYSEILVGICNFTLPLTFNAPVGVIPLDDLRDFWWVSCRVARLQYGAKYPRKVKTKYP